MATRRKPRPKVYGAGNVVELASGKFRGRVMVNGKRESVTGDTEAEVLEVMAELRDGDGLPPSEVAPTLGEWLDEWIVDYSPDNAERTIESYRWGLAKFDPLRDVGVLDVTVTQLEERVRELARGKLGRRSCALALGYLAMAFDAYYTRESLAVRNPARDAKLPKSARKAKERRILTPDQVVAFVTTADGDPLESLFLTMLLCGLRPGEALGLPWHAVDLDAGTLDVVQFQRVTRTADGVEVTMEDPKSKSDRRMDLHPIVVAALRRRQTEQKRQKLAASKWTETGLVHTTCFGTPIDQSNLRRYVRRILDDAGIDVPLMPYELRHTAGSTFVESGMPLEEVADLLGHSVKVLLDHYRHRSKRRVSAHLQHTDAILASAN